MQETDQLIKIIDKNGQLRLTLLNSTGVVEEAHRRHHTSATASAALGRVLTAALILGSDLKGERDLVSIRVSGDGEGGPIIATADSNGGVRGMITNPMADLPSRYPGKLAVGELVGRNGFLEIIKDMGLKQPFVGRTPLVSGEIAEDLSQYFYQSEQIPSLISLGVLVETDLSIQSAGGILIQAMPGAEDAILERIEENVMALGPVSELMSKTQRLEEIAAAIMKEQDFDIIDRRQISFRCTCNRERLAAIMAEFEEREIDEIYSELGMLEVRCDFCNEVYHYQPGEIKAIKKDKALDRNI